MNGVFIMKEKDLEKIKIIQLLLQKQVTVGAKLKLPLSPK